MSVSASYEHEFVAASPSPANAFSEAEPSEEEKKQIKERISTNLQKLYQDAEELYKRRMQDSRSDEERARLKEDLKVEIGRIRTLGAEEYHTQLELERQQRRWALGQPIDDKWKDIIMREQNKIFESFKSTGSNSTDPVPQNGIQRPRSNDHTTNGGTSTHFQLDTASEPPPPPHPEIPQRKASRSREDRPLGVRPRRESDTPSIKEEHRHATYLEDRASFIEPWTSRNDHEGPEAPSIYDHPNPSRTSISRSPNQDRSEDDRASVRTSERGQRVVPSSPAKHEIWRPSVAAAEDDSANSRRSLARRGSTASQRSIGSTSIRSLTTEPIPERPDVNENEGRPHVPQGEPTKAPSEKGKERSRAFQIATEQTEQHSEDSPLPFSNLPKPPHSAPPGRLSSDRPAPGPYYPPSRSASVKHARLDDDDRVPATAPAPTFPPIYKSPRRHGSKSSFTTDLADSSRFGLGPSSAIDEHEPIREWDFAYRPPLHNQRPIVTKPSLNELSTREPFREEDSPRHGPDWVPGKRSRMGSTSSREYRDGDDWTGSLRLRNRPSRNFIPTSPFADDSSISYNRHSPESPRPPLSRGASFTRSIDDHDVGSVYNEGYQRLFNPPPSSSSIPINRGKAPRSSPDDYGASSWRGWGKPDGRLPPSDGRSSYELFASPPSLSASSKARHHDFGGRETNHRNVADHVPETDEDSIRRRLQDLERAEREEAVRREEAERKMQEVAKKQREEERKLKEKLEEVKKKEEMARRKEEEAKKKVEEANKKEEEAKKKQEEARRLEEDARRMEVEAKRREEEAKRKEEEASAKEAEARAKEEEAAKKEEEARQKEIEARRKEREAHKKEQEAKRKEQEARRKEQEARRLEEEARRIEEEARRREEETDKREEEIEKREEEAMYRAEEIRKKTEEIRRREDELRRREEELERREAESRLEDERLQEARLQEEEEKRLQEEERQQEEARLREEEEKQREEEARLREEVESIKKREDEIARRRQELARKEEERKKREDERRRQEDERRHRLEEERRIIEEERRRLEEDKRRREQEEEERREAERRLQEEAERRRARIQEDERRRQEQIAAKRQLEEERQRQQEEEVRREQERIHQDIMQREWKKRRNENSQTHTVQQGAYDRQREEIQKRKGEERKHSFDSAFMPSSPSTSASPLSSGRPPAAGPQRQGSVGASAWTQTTGFTWKTAPNTASPNTSSSSASSSARSSTSSTTSATSASSSTPTPTPKPKAAGPGTTSTPPISESEWARRQAEQAKEQQERFRREQEKLENQRIASEMNKTITDRDLVQLYQQHEARWKDLNTFEVLRWESFPWPMIKRPKTAEDVKESTIYAYLFTKFYPENNKSDKDRVKEHIKRWHPDKFNTKYLPKVIDEDQERVKEGAGAVVRGLNAILTKMNEPDKPSLFG